MKILIQLIAIIGITTLSNFNIEAQVDIATHAWSTGFHVGWNTAHSLDFKIGTTPTSLMSLTTTGDLNLFNGTTSPTDKNAYQIGGYSVLWHNGVITRIFVGYGAGNGTMTAVANTLVGYKTGNIITTGDSNVVVGTSAGTSIITARYNTAVGFEALKNDTDADNNVAIGYGALRVIAHGVYDPVENITESENTAVGVNALEYNRAYGGCALGYQAGQGNVHGCSLIAIGEEAARGALDGNDNTAIGEATMRDNKYLSQNVAVGFVALRNLSYNPLWTCPVDSITHDSIWGCVASNNVAVGNFSLQGTNPSSSTSGILNSGMNNTSIGDTSGATNITGYNLSFLGFKADVCHTCSLGVHNSTAIGANAVIVESDNMILGNNSVKVGIGLSANTIGPRSKLEISSGSTGISGLQFRNLTSTYSPSSSAAKFLTVDTSGKVILLNDGSAGAFNGTTIDASTLKVQLGQDVGGSGGDLVNHREIPMNEFDIYFTEPAALGTDDGNNIFMGIPASVSPAANDPRLNVAKSTMDHPYINESIAGNFTSTVPYNDATAFGYGVCGTATQPFDDNITNYRIAGGVFRGISGNVRNGTYGVIGKGHSDGAASVTCGGAFTAIVTNSGGAYSVGVEGDAAGASINLGVFGQVSCSTCTDYAGYFNGDVYTSSAVYYTSDSILKTNVSPISNISSQIMKLHPYSYSFNNSLYPQLNLAPGINYGLYSEEVEREFPSLVHDIPVLPKTDSTGNIINPGGTIKGLNYIGMIPLLLGALQEQNSTIQEQQNEIDSLKSNDSINNARMNQLEQMINNCCANSPTNPTHRQINSIDIDLGSENSIMLNSAVPDPFAESTRITFTIPSEVKEAKIIFFDNLGHVLQTVIINERGNGQINVYADNLSSGIYSYTLIADGKVIDTKKMVCSK